MLDDTDSGMFEASKNGPGISLRQMKALEPYIGAIEDRVRDACRVDGAKRISERLARNAPFPLGGSFDPMHHLGYADLRSLGNSVFGCCPS